MSRERSTLFARSALSNSGVSDLLPMPPDIQAIYDAGQRNTPYSTDVDDALAAHRHAHGEPEQTQHAQRVDLCDAVSLGRKQRYSDYVSQRRYAVRAYCKACMHPDAMARLLGVPVHTIRNDLTTMRLRRTRPAQSFPTLAKCSPTEIQGLLDQGMSHAKVAERLGVSDQAVGKFCKANGLTNRAQMQRQAKVFERRERVRLLSDEGLSIAKMAERLGVTRGLVSSDRAKLKLPRQGPLGPTLAKFSPSAIQGLLDRGLTQGKLAKRLGVSHQAVSQFCLANGLTNPAHARRRKKITERQEMVRLLSAEGLSIAEMAERLGVFTHVVSGDRVNLKLPRRKTPIDEFTLLGLSRAEVRRLLMQFETVGALARHLNTSSPLVSKYLKRVELKAPRDDRGKHRLKR